MAGNNSRGPEHRGGPRGAPPLRATGLQVMLRAGAVLIGAAQRAERPPRSERLVVARGRRGWLAASPVTDSVQPGCKGVKDGASRAGQPVLKPLAAVLCLGPCCQLL